MSSCGHSTTFCFLPPTLTFLQENFPTLTPDTSIDRTLLRCRLCDLIDTQAAADLAETGPPGLEKEADIEKEVAELKQAITEGIKTDIENALPKLQRKLNAAVQATDERILQVWMAYWAVWGPGDGPDREDEGFLEEEFEIEFPPEEAVLEKVVPVKTIPDKTAPEQAVPEVAPAEKSKPKKTANAAKVDSSPAKTTVKPAIKRGRPVKRGKK